MTMATLNVTKMIELEGHKDCIYAMTHGADPNELYTGGGDGWVVYWNLNEGAQGQLIATFPTSIFSMIYFPESHRMMVGLSKGGFYLLDLAEKQRIANFYKEHGIFDFRLIPYTNRMVAVGSKGHVHVVDIATLEEITSFQVSSSNARKVNISPDAQQFAIGFSDEQIRLFNAETFRLEETFHAHQYSTFSVVYSPDEQYLISGGRDAQLRIWERTAAGIKAYKTIPAHYFTINEIVVSPCHRWIATGSRDKTVKVWDLENFELFKVIDFKKLGGHIHSVNDILWMTYNGYLVSAGDDKTVKVWSIDD